MATKLKAYSTTAGSNNSAPPDGWPEGMLPSTVNDTGRQMMARLAEWYADAEWILRNDTITAFTGSTITITGDVTAKYTANRAIRLDESGSKVGIITGSVYGAPSTVVTITGYTILALPTSVELGIIDSTKVGLVQISGAQTVTGDKTFSGTLAMSAKPINEADRVDVASVAGTTDLDAAASNYVRITGTNTVTAFTLSNGNRRHVLAGGAFAITTGASLIFPGLASGTTYTFTAGDTFTIIGEDAGVVRVQSYTRVNGGADGLLSTTTASAAAQADITLPAGFRNYRVEFDASVGTDGDNVNLRVSTDGGSTFKAGASDYDYAYSVITGSDLPDDVGSTASTLIPLATTVGSAAAEGCAGTVTIYHPASTTRYKHVLFHTAAWDNTATSVFRNTQGSGSYNTDTNAINALRFIATTGTITGTFKLYGYQ